MWVIWCPQKADGQRVLVADIGMDALERLAEPHTWVDDDSGKRRSMMWLDFINAPGRNGLAFIDLYRMACERVGVEPVAEVTPRMLLGESLLELRPDDEDVPATYGSDADKPTVLFPKGEGAAVTTS
jgi:hypothetical protein